MSPSPAHSLLSDAPPWPLPVLPHAALLWPHWPFVRLRPARKTSPVVIVRGIRFLPHLSGQRFLETLQDLAAGPHFDLAQTSGRNQTLGSLSSERACGVSGGLFHGVSTRVVLRPPAPREVTAGVFSAALRCAPSWTCWPLSGLRSPKSTLNSSWASCTSKPESSQPPSAGRCCPARRPPHFCLRTGCWLQPWGHLTTHCRAPTPPFACVNAAVVFFPFCYKKQHSVTP